MTQTERSILDELRDRNPFQVPEGYFEGFTDDFMRRLPEKTAPEAKVISLYDRLKPWLYVAATLAGIIVLFNIFTKSPEMSKDVNLKASIHVDLEEEDDDEFLEFMVDMYAMSSVNYNDYLFDN